MNPSSKSNSNPMVEKTGHVLRVLRQRRWPAIGAAWVVALGSAIAIPFMPERYEATARIYVDTQTVLKPLMAGLAYQPDVDQQVRMLARTLVSRPNVSRLLESPDNGFVITNPKQREAVLARLMDQIRIVAAERGNLYTISYRDTESERARRLVEGTVALFMNTGVDGKKKDSVDASKFIDEQITSTEAKLTNAENRLKQFKIRNFGVSGVSNQDYFARMSTLSDDVAKLASDLQAAEQARDAYKRELSGEDPQLPPTLPPVGAVAPSARDIDFQIETARKRVDELQQRFTDEHPDVIAARRQVEQLEQEKVSAAAAAKVSGVSTRGVGASGTAATSPVYQKLRFALAESEAQVASLRSQLSAQSGRLAQIRALAGRVPQVEAELAQLNRDYDVVRKNYDLLVARRESASLGVKLDESAQLTDFRVVEPPRVSPSPVFPGRLHLALIAAALTALAGLGTALVMDLLRPTVTGTAELEALSGRPVLGAVGLTKTPATLHMAQVNRTRFVGATGLLAAMQLAWILWLAIHTSAS